AHCWLLPRLPRFLSAHPDLRISLDTGMSLARFDDGGPDLAIRHGPGHWPGLRARHLMDDALFPVAAPSLPGIEGIAGARDLLSFPLLSDLALQGWPDWFRTAGLRGQRLPEMHMFNDSTDVMRAAAVGIGIGLARKHLVAPRPQPAPLPALGGP